MEIALILSSRCNASCGHCSASCGPLRKEMLSKDDIMRLMNETAAIDDGEPLYFHITGGEPFLDFDLLVETVAHGARLGGQVSCVTNAYWARSVEIAHAKLSVLRDAGLGVIAVSVSRFHHEFVSLRRARIALQVARSVGLRTELKGGVTHSDLQPNGVHAQWQSELDADEINIFPIIPCLREGTSLPEGEYYREPGLPTLRCPEEIVCIDSDGAAMSCCGQHPTSEFLSIGNIHTASLATIRRRFMQGGKQEILRKQGPIAFARGAIAAGMGHLLRSSYAGPCDLCVHIGTDPNLRRLADEMSAAAGKKSKLRRKRPRARGQRKT